MKRVILLILLLSASSYAQEVFQIKNASKLYDVRLKVENCQENSCDGEATFTVFKKGQTKPFQSFSTPTMFSKEETKRASTKLRYDYQSVVFFEDYNFDGVEDLAIRDGNNGGYGGPSYQIYLFSPKTGKFVHSSAFTELNQGAYLGAVEVDKKKKVLRGFSKSGCCWHQTEEFLVVNNRPKKVYEYTEDASIPDDNRVKLTTKRLVGGRWRTTVKYVKR